MNIISNIISRDCHVSMTNRQVIRHVISRLKNKESTFWALSKENRRILMETCIKEHQENIRLYLDVIYGNL